MKVSYNSLKPYFVESLPELTILTEALIAHSFEVEAIEAFGEDWLFEVKILPDRASDAKNPLGLAREIASVLKLSLKPEYAVETTRDNARLMIKFKLGDLVAISGLDLSSEQVVNYLSRVGVVVTPLEAGVFEALIPKDRLDLNITEDLADEVVRLGGYDQIPTVSLPTLKEAPAENTIFVLMNQLRRFFLEQNFTEIYGYTFAKEGKVQVEKPVASDKAFLRTDLSSGLRESLKNNLRHLLFDQEAVKLFELGNVFINNDLEEKHLCFGIAYRSGKFDQSEKIADEIIHGLSANFALKAEEISKIKSDNLTVIEVKLDALQKSAQRPADLRPFLKSDLNYQPFSIYPSIIRDIALFVPREISAEMVSQTIKKSAGDLLVKEPVLFDRFEKNDQISYAFRLVFQSLDRTLADNEINQIMGKIVEVLEATLGWQVRK